MTISILLQACSGLQDGRAYPGGGGGNDDTTTGDSTDDGTTTTQSNELRNSLVQALRDGEYIEINFNRAGHVDDVEWLNQGDPMGPLQAGRKYVLSFDEETGEFTTVGWHESREQNWVATYSNADLNAFEVSLWGREFLLIQEQSVVLIRDPAFDVVGEARIITTPSIDGVRSRLMSGDELSMNFNQLDPELDATQTGSNVPGWSGSFATDPLGTFLIGEEYLLYFDSDEDAFEVIGFQESTGDIIGSTTSRTLLNGHEAQILENEFNAWGLGFEMLQAPDGLVLFRCINSSATAVCEDLNIVGEIE
ncbi:MAG: hypothetical protein ACO3LE_09890 [Bdellovibrionota bacterium]